MSTLTHTPAGTTGSRRSPLRIRGLAWLMFRQHRVMFLMVAAFTVLGAIWLVYQRAASLDAVRGAGWPGRPADKVDSGVVLAIHSKLEKTVPILSALPVVLGVFCGAPLIASDQEQGTAQLATTQSVPRKRWLSYKLGTGVVLVLLPTIVLGSLFTWWWRAVRVFGEGDWMQGTVFDNTGPMLAALTLFTAVGGIAIGLIARRVLAAMVGTFLFAVVTQVVWSFVRPELAAPRRISYPIGAEFPAKLSDAVQVDNWVSTASGELFGYGTCVQEEKYEACLADKGIVNATVEYFGYDQMPVMQWTGAGILGGLSVLLIAFIVVRVGRRPL
ncbi:ABC transporter permease [Streptomyces sp. NBC_01320]|uniref:ABC transporter permease n=1 Tax=Streptomyces sp. NBC_01320 TaxID=2903824 RepID=UPI002E0D872A|nr:ABC transporter permease [Streptomyces sp. NBC_01320]